jgi:uncharacterized repeat protein (TIGR03803 family)
MRQKNSWFNASTVLVIVGMALVLTPSIWAGSTFKVLHKFTGDPDGAEPFGGLVFDRAGNLYGATLGGAHQQGAIFRLKPNLDGSWTETVLYSFAGGSDGSFPNAGLVFDAAGKDLYGTTLAGGSSACGGGCGTVFKLRPSSNGSWTESVLHKFTAGSDGAHPSGGLRFDAAGNNLYGTTGVGGSSGLGTVFRLTLNSNGSWTESVLYSFAGGSDGSFPNADLVFDAAGKDLHGTTQAGGSSACVGGGFGCGTVFKLQPSSNGSWTESVLYRFIGDTDGAEPLAGLVSDADGNLFGTTGLGGCLACGDGCGTVFRLKPNADGSWTEIVIHRFDNRSGDIPFAVIFDASGNLYGATTNGGSNNCAIGGCGTAFRLKPNSDGSWTYSVLHYFFGEPAANPIGSLVLDNASLNLYGTTVHCGTNVSCKGVVFEITP